MPFLQALTEIGKDLSFAAIALIFLFIVKLWRDWRTPFDDNREIEENSNLAVGIRRLGLFTGTAIGMIGALIGFSEGYLNDLKYFTVDGIIVVILMLVARRVNDSLICAGVNNNKAVHEGNLAVALVEAGSYIATGLIVKAAFSGEGGGIMAAVIFALIGQLALLILFGIYRFITRFDVKKEILEGNSAAGLAVAGMLISLAVILHTSIAGPFISWSVDLLLFTKSALLGIVSLFIFRWLIDLVFLPNTNLKIEIERDKNVAAVAVAQGVLLAFAIILSAVI